LSEAKCETGWGGEATGRDLGYHHLPLRHPTPLAARATLPLQGRVKKAHLRILATHSARVLEIHRPPKRKRAHATLKRGRGEDRVRAAPAVSCARVDRKAHTSIQVQRRHSGLPCAMVLRLIFVLSPVRPKLVCHRRCADTSAQLDTSHRGVRTTRLCRPLQPRSSVAALASIAPRPAFRDECAYAPFGGTGWRKK
jgi:hypothetical protein